MRNLTLLLLLTVSHALASTYYTGGTYSQDFSSIRNEAIFTTYTSTPEGWTISPSYYYWTNGGAGVTNNASIFSFSSVPSANDKALGIFPVAAATTPSITLSLLNVTQNTYTEFLLSYIGEQWRKGAVLNSPDTLKFEYSINPGTISATPWLEINALNFTTPQPGDGIAGPLDGNQSSNQSNLFAIISGMIWKPGDTLSLRWSMTRNPTYSEAHALAIDDVIFQAVPEPNVIMLLTVGFGLIFLQQIKQKARKG